jgi:hypothetical protein
MFAYTVVEVGTKGDDLVCLAISHTPHSKERLTSTLLMNGIQ